MDEKIDNDPADGDSAMEQRLVVHRNDSDSAVVLVVDGDVDLVTVTQMENATDEAMAQAKHRPVVIDLSEVSFLSSHGLRTLIGAHKAADAEAGPRPLRIVAGQNRPVIRPIQLTGLDEVLALYETVADAVADRPSR